MGLEKAVAKGRFFVFAVILAFVLLIFVFGSLGLCSASEANFDSRDIAQKYNSFSAKLPGFVRKMVGNEIIVINLTLINGTVRTLGAKTENGTIKEIQEGAYPDSSLAVYISESVLDKIGSSSNPAKIVQDSWGKEIRLKGLRAGTGFKVFFINIGARFWRFFRSAANEEMKPMPAVDFYIIHVFKTPDERCSAEISPDFDTSFDSAMSLSLSGESISCSAPGGVKSAKKLFEVKGILWDEERKLDVKNWTSGYNYEKAFKNYRQAVFLKKIAAQKTAEIKNKLDEVPAGKHLCLLSDALLYISGDMITSEIGESSGNPDTIEEIIERIEMKLESVNRTLFNEEDCIARMSSNVMNEDIALCPPEVEDWLTAHPDVIERTSRYNAHALEISMVAIYGGYPDESASAGYRVIFPDGTRNKLDNAMRSINRDISRMKDFLDIIFNSESEGHTDLSLLGGMS